MTDEPRAATRLNLAKKCLGLKYMSAYTLETLSFEKGPFFSVCATYVIHLANNGRLDSVMRELKAKPPSRTVHIVFNQGPKGKNLPEETPAQDIIHAYKHVFQDAATRGYDRILVLEDDFFFRPDLGSPDVASVNRFLETPRKHKWVYQLGCIPGLMVPCGNESYATVAFASHACVYSKQFREYALGYTKKIRDWDVFCLLHCVRYTYTKPLCYQLFTETENYKDWFRCFGLVGLLKWALKKLQLDKHAEPGFSLCYLFAKVMFYVGCVVLLGLGYAVYAFRAEFKRLFFLLMDRYGRRI